MSADRENWPWGVLGLDGRAPEREVRRAYARRLKQMDPEAEPEAFEALRAAYEFARRIAGPTEPAQPAPELEPELAPEAGAAEEPPQPPASGDSPEDPVAADEEPHGAAEEAAQEASFAEAIARLDALIKARDFSVDDWEALLNHPSLDPPEASLRFERTLIGRLKLVFAPGSGDAASHRTIGAPWIELIEARYGWKSDGLRFRAQFPANMDVRETYLALRQQVGLDLAQPKPRAAGRYLSAPNILRLLVSPPAFAVLLFIGLFVVFGDAGRSVRRADYGLMMLCSAVLWVILPRKWKAWPVPRFLTGRLGGPGNWVRRHSAFALALNVWLVWLRRRSMLALALNAWLVALFVGYIQFVVMPNYHQGWIAEREVPSLTYTLQLSSWWNFGSNHAKGDIAPVFELADGTARSLKAGRVSEAEALKTLDLPFPVIAIAAPFEGIRVMTSSADMHFRVIKPAPFYYLSLRSGEAMLAVTTGTEIHVQAAIVPTGQVQDFTLAYPRIELAWNKQGALKGTPGVTPRDFSGELLMQKIPTYISSNPLDLSYSKSGPGAPRDAVDLAWDIDLADLRLVPGKDGAPPRLRAVPLEGAGGGARLSSCRTYMRGSFLRTAALINPRADELMSEVCTIPRDVLRLTWSAKGGAGETQTGPLEWQLTHPLERFMFALAPDAQGAAPDTPEQRALSRGVSDQIIRDYLTIFWSAPLPDRLKTYLSAHPELGPPPQAPDRAVLGAAIARQPHLVNLYRFRDELGAAVLRDMFDYLGRKHLLVVEGEPDAPGPRAPHCPTPSRAASCA